MDTPDWKAPEKKVSHKLVGESLDKQISASDSAFAPPIEIISSDYWQKNLSETAEPLQSAQPGFVHRHERDLFWLAVIVCLHFIATWFAGTHGYFEFSSTALNQFFSMLSLAFPILAALLLTRPAWSKDKGLIAVIALITLLFFPPFFVTNTFIVLFCCWTKSARKIASVALVIIFVSAWYWRFEPVDSAAAGYKLSTSKHNLSFNCRPIFLIFGSRVELSLVEKMPVTPFLYFVKVHWVTNVYPWDIPRIVPIDSDHVYVLIEATSRYTRSFVDLSRVNKAIPKETNR